MHAGMSVSAARLHPPTASDADIRAACEARAAAAALAREEGRETVPWQPAMSTHPPVGGHYPERLPGPCLGASTWETVRACIGPGAQIAAPLLLAALAFLR